MSTRLTQRDSGALPLSYVIIVPVFLLALMVITQAAMWFLARSAALAAARQGADAARVQPVSLAAGVSAAEIRRAARFGRALNEILPQLPRASQGPFLEGLRAVTVNPRILLVERIGYRSFRIWGRALRAAGNPGSLTRKPILLVYLCFLVAAILTILPITASVAAIVARFSRRTRDEALTLELPSGSSSYRLAQFDQPS